MKRAIASIFLAAVALLVSGPARGQAVFEPSPSMPVVPSSLRESMASGSFSLPFGTAENSTPLTWGPVNFKPHLNEKFVYSTGIQVAPGRAVSSHINALSIGVGGDVGRHWSFDYTPTWTAYSNHAFENSIDHFASIAAAYEFSEWYVNFNQSYSKSNETRIETGQQTEQETSLTALNFAHRFNDHLSTEIALAQNLQYLENSPDFNDWSAQIWAVYRVVMRMDVSLGYRFGYTDFDPGAYMTYTQPSVRVRWRVADKITLSAQAGRETRKMHKTTIPDQTTPTYNAGIQYQPFEQTLISFDTQRAVTPGYFTNSVTDNRGWDVGLKQRLLSFLSLDATYGRSTSHYEGSHLIAFPNFYIIDLRNDSTRHFRGRLSTPILQRGTFSVLYENTKNTSDLGGYSFNSRQIGCEFSYRF